jgi:hypothetical protein
MCIKKLVSQTYLDIKKLVEETPNDMDLGKVIRNYIEKEKEKIEKDDDYENV